MQSNPRGDLYRYSGFFSKSESKVKVKGIEPLLVYSEQRLRESAVGSSETLPGVFLRD